MNSKDFVREYKELIKETLVFQSKLSSSLDKALLRLETERKRYEDFNNADWATKHKSLLVLLAPIATILLIMLGAFLFVSTGHTISVGAGDYKIQAK